MQANPHYTRRAAILHAISVAVQGKHGGVLCANAQAKKDCFSIARNMLDQLDIPFVTHKGALVLCGGTGKVSFLNPPLQGNGIDMMIVDEVQDAS